jgi:hypothetical protein
MAYSIAVSKLRPVPSGTGLRRPFLSDFFIAVRLPRRREQFTEKGRGVASPLRWIPARAGMTPAADFQGSAGTAPFLPDRLDLSPRSVGRRILVFNEYAGLSAEESVSPSVAGFCRPRNGLIACPALRDRPRHDALRSPRTNLIAPSLGPKDAEPPLRLAVHATRPTVREKVKTAHAKPLRRKGVQSGSPFSLLCDPCVLCAFA